MPRLSLASGAPGVSGWTLSLIGDADECHDPAYPAPPPIPPGLQLDGVRCSVPGDVHSALIDAGKIPDPFFADNELRVQWVGGREWEMRTEFDVGRVLRLKTRSTFS